MGSAANILFNNFGLLGAMVECRTDILLKIIREMVDAQRREKPLFWAWAITEPSAGTDVEDGHAMATMKPSAHAEKVQGGYRLNGRKCFITNGSVADFFVVYAYTNPKKGSKGISAFVIERDTSGLKYGKNENKMGMRGSINSELIFDDMEVPAENLIGEEGDGFGNLMTTLALSRLFCAAQAVGIAVARGARSVPCPPGAVRPLGLRAVLACRRVRGVLVSAVRWGCAFGVHNFDVLHRPGRRRLTHSQRRPPGRSTVGFR